MKRGISMRKEKLDLLPEVIRGTMLKNNITNYNNLNHKIRPEDGQPPGGR
jgi:hypothetical protein